MLSFSSIFLSRTLSASSSAWPFMMRSKMHVYLFLTHFMFPSIFKYTKEGLPLALLAMFQTDTVSWSLPWSSLSPNFDLWFSTSNTCQRQYNSINIISISSSNWNVLNCSRWWCFGRILFYHCSNRNEEVFGQKKNPRYLRQNILLDDEAERTFGGRAMLLVAGQYFCWPGNTFSVQAILLVVCQTRGPPLLTQASCSNCKSNNYGMGLRQKVK